MINRISINGCRYVIGNRDELENFCKLKNISIEWIREKRGKLYLRLWGSYKNKK